MRRHSYKNARTRVSISASISLTYWCTWLLSMNEEHQYRADCDTGCVMCHSGCHRTLAERQQDMFHDCGCYKAEVTAEHLTGARSYGQRDRPSIHVWQCLWVTSLGNISRWQMCEFSWSASVALRQVHVYDGAQHLYSVLKSPVGFTCVIWMVIFSGAHSLSQSVLSRASLP